MKQDHRQIKTHLDIIHKQERFPNGPLIGQVRTGIHRIACEQWGPAMHVRQHRLQTCWMGLVTDGHGHAQCNDQSPQPLSADTVFIHPFHCQRTITVDPGKTLSLWIIVTAGRWATALCRRILQTPVLTITLSDPAPLVHECRAIYNAGYSHGEHAAGIRQLRFELLLHLIAQQYHQTHHRHNRAWQTYQQSRQYILDHAEKLHDVESVARACQIHPVYLCRLFKKYGHATPLAFLQQQRMQRAGYYLSTTSMTVRQVAELLNIDCPFAFSRTFKRIMGLSPTHWRTTKQSDID